MNQEPCKEYVSIDFIDKSFRVCSRHKRGTDGYIEYSMNFIENNYKLWVELNSMTYEIGVSKAFCVTTPCLREVFSAQFRDRVVHTMLDLKFGPLLEEELTDCAYACRTGKGTTYGIADVREQIRRVSNDYTIETWVLKGDLQGFFMSIIRLKLYCILEATIRRKYHEDDIEWWLWLWKKVILHDPTKDCIKKGDLALWDKLPTNKSLFTCGKGKGLPIGNLPSQMLENLLMSVFDKWVLNRIGKEGGYGRYVDDFVIISRDKKELLCLWRDARVFLRDELGLTLHPHKVYLQEAKKGIRFTGVMIRPGRSLPNPRTIEHLYDVIDEFGRCDNPRGEELVRFVNRINSLLGLIAQYASYNIRRKAWTMMSHKDRVYCKNMRIIKIKSNFKRKVKL